ncbi:MAG TPA: TonB family protein [Rhodoblastus sp.]|nr:TonB family protein [Rhodoblastus sp.]
MLRIRSKISILMRPYVSHAENVTIHITIAADGRVADAKVVTSSGNPNLDRDIVASIRQLDPDKPPGGRMTIPVRLVLRR